MKTNTISPSRIEMVETRFLSEKKVSLFVKREDLIHPTISGNKWRKLKYNLSAAKEFGYKTIITFGGAFSNHIYATAAACREFGFKSVGIIRGEFDANNPTLNLARAQGMEIQFVDRQSYREKENSPRIKELLDSYNNYLLIPEGGSNQLAKEGLKELAQEINLTNHNKILVSAGTGCTAAGILEHLDKDKKLWVFTSLKSDHLKNEILDQVNPEKHTQLKFISSYHFGGYGKSPKELIDFINDFKGETGINTDPIYNGKLVSGFMDMVRRGAIDTHASYLWVHTGGLQGVDAYNYMAGKKGRVLLK